MQLRTVCSRVLPDVLPVVLGRALLRGRLLDQCDGDDVTAVHRLAAVEVGVTGVAGPGA